MVIDRAPDSIWDISDPSNIESTERIVEFSIIEPIGEIEGD
jgi:hypothetical protein